jgi:hypothetical protein
LTFFRDNDGNGNIRIVRRSKAGKPGFFVLHGRKIKLFPSSLRLLNVLPWHTCPTDFLRPQPSH